MISSFTDLWCQWTHAVHHVRFFLMGTESSAVSNVRSIEEEVVGSSHEHSKKKRFADILFFTGLCPTSPFHLKILCGFSEVSVGAEYSRRCSIRQKKKKKSTLKPILCVQIFKIYGIIVKRKNQILVKLLERGDQFNLIQLYLCSVCYTSCYYTKPETQRQHVPVAL